MTVSQPRSAWRIKVGGTVQGVGFRPFVFRLATQLGLDGSVRNVDGAVLIEASGQPASLQELVRSLWSDAPPLAVVSSVDVIDTAAPFTSSGFQVVPSERVSPAATVLGGLPADVATCADCLRELFDPADRRYRYPFLNCTNCGPRATIVDELPYDRARTAMAGFPLCTACAAEYADPTNRRFHAEPIACPSCGPTLLWQPGGHTGEDALLAAIAVISAGGIVALKGLGGYQLVCDATRPSTVAELRQRKHRPTKPFAVMVRDVAFAASLARLTPSEEAALQAAARPIVLVPIDGDDLAPEVHPGTHQVGLFLPATPLHHLLLHGLARPLVVTSGNLSDEPICISDDEAAQRLGRIADGVLSHNRPIRARYDDSVVRVRLETPVLVRRARGYAPEALRLPVRADQPVLAVGAQLKHTFTLAMDDRALVGPHGGSLNDADAFEAFKSTLDQLCRLHRFTPRVVAHDRHPDYLSTQFASELDLPLVPVQHHHAHVASCAAEHGLTGPFLGVAYDGLGFGDDGTLWGGEVLLATYTEYRRLARFSRAPMPGGEAAIRRPARMALGYLFGAEFPIGSADGFPVGSPDGLVGRLDPREVSSVRQLVTRGVRSPLTSSAGRLFDAVASLLGICDDAGYEGEAAVRLESAAVGDASALPWRIAEADGLWVYDSGPTLAALLDASASGEPVGAIAAAFHRTVIAATVELCARAATRTGVEVVCLSGGCLQNRLLADGLATGLASAGLRPYLNRLVPANDGGISYGQAAIAAAVTREGS